MSRIIIILSLFIFGTLQASTPSLQLVSTWTTDALSTSSKDTLTVTGVSLSGDSIGVMLDFNRDSVSGYVTYQYITPSGNSNTIFANADTLFEFDCNEGQQAAFGGPIPASAGNYQVYLYLILTNDDATTQTVTTNMYTIIWR